MFSMRSGAAQYGEGSAGGPGFNLFRFIKRFAVLLFAIIQGVLVARILIDIGLLPGENSFGTFVIVWSDTLATPVQGLAGLGGFFGGGLPVGVPGVPGVPGIPGMPAAPDPASTGLNMVMIAALAGWTVVEWLVMRVVNKLQQV